MIIRFSVIAFVPPKAQLGVVGSASFLGEWKLEHCVPLIPYSSPHPTGSEPSLWFRDIDISSLAPSPSSSSFSEESNRQQRQRSEHPDCHPPEDQHDERKREEGPGGGGGGGGGFSYDRTGYGEDEGASSSSFSSRSNDRHLKTSFSCPDCPFAVELLSVSRASSCFSSCSCPRPSPSSSPTCGCCKGRKPATSLQACGNEACCARPGGGGGGDPVHVSCNSHLGDLGSGGSGNLSTRGVSANGRDGESRSPGREGKEKGRGGSSAAFQSHSLNERQRRRLTGRTSGPRGKGRFGSGSIRAGGRGAEGWESVYGSVAYHLSARDPKVQAVLGRHPLRNFHFDYKFVLWYPLESPPLPYCVSTMGDPDGASGVYTGAGGGDEEDAEREGEEGRHWRKWLFPPIPARQPTPPKPGDHVIWEGYGPDSNRKFSFDPYDVVVDVNELGHLECLYISKIGHFRDPRAGGTGEYELTTRFYNTVKSECRMHYSTVFPGFYVGSCPRQLQHIRFLKEDLKVTCVVNLQTEQDICNNYPDPVAGSRSAEAVSHLYEGAGLRYVWLPTTDMSDSARKIAVANAAFLLLGLFKSGHSVYIHCNAGVGRSVAAACAFLCFAIGLDLRKVNFLICAKRPVAYWDEKAMKFGVNDYQSKFGKCLIVGPEGEEEEEQDEEDEE